MNQEEVVLLHGEVQLLLGEVQQSSMGLHEIGRAHV